MKKVRGLIVGMGAISGWMLNVLRQMPWFELAGVGDVRKEALAAAQTKYGLPQRLLHSNLLDAIDVCGADAAIVNTPSHLHYEQTRLLLEARLHVLAAKPLTNDFERAVELVELAETNGLKLAVGQQGRYFRHYLAVKRFIDSGRLGGVESAILLNSKPRHSVLNFGCLKHPVLLEMSCHHFDSLLALFPSSDPEWIMIDGFQPSWSVYNGPCMLNGIIRYSGNLRVLYHAGYSAQSDCYELRLEGNRGVLRCRGIHSSNDEITNEFADSGGKFAHSSMDADMPVQDPWIPFFDAWHAFLGGGAEPPFSGRNNLKVFALLSAGIESCERGQPVEVSGNPRYAAAFQPHERAECRLNEAPQGA